MAGEMVEIFDEEVDSDNEKFLVHSGVDRDGDLTVTIEKYLNETDNDTEIVGTGYYYDPSEDEEDDASLAMPRGFEPESAFGKKNKRAIEGILGKHIDENDFRFSSGGLEKSFDKVVADLSKIR